MTRHLLLAVLLFATVLTVHARIGETEKELIARYGPPVQKKPASNKTEHSLVFEKPPFLITAGFIAGRCEWVSYRKLSGAAINLEQATLILDTIGGGWEPVPNTSTWQKPEGLLAELLPASKPTALTLSTQTYRDYVNTTPSRRIADEVKGL